MKKALPLLFALLKFHVRRIAETQAYNWVFGAEAGVSWNSGAPVSFTGAQIYTAEGCASISDANGQLLFYTDGITLWDRNNNIMPKRLRFICGNSSTTQSGVIVPAPGSSTIYYIFAVDVEAGPNGVSYSQVDMTLNAGLGDVNGVKNVILFIHQVAKNLLPLSRQTALICGLYHISGITIHLYPIRSLRQELTLHR